MKRVSLVVLTLLTLAATAFAQAPAAPAGATRVAIMDFNQAVTETEAGKKAADLIIAQMTEKQTEFQNEQKALTDLEEKLRTQGPSLNESARADLNRQITAKQTVLTRINEDAQETYATLQETHFGPIAQLVSKVVESYATEAGFAVVFDAATQPTNIIYHSQVADITTEIIRRANAEAARTGTPAGATTTPAAPTPAP